jgi:SGT1 protein
MASLQQFESPLEQSSLLTSTKQNTLILDIFLVPIRPPPKNASNDDQNDHVPQQQQQQQRLFVALADLAVTLNAHFAATRYPWFSGGDGVVFGLHCSPAAHDQQFDGQDSPVGDSGHDRSSTMIPHLRGACRYGVSVADEWQAIQLLLLQRFDRETTVDKSTATTNHTYQMVTECWDVDDGQVLLIEASEHLPRWVDDIGPDQCRHRCWIVSHDTFSETESGGLAITPRDESLRGGSICLIAPTNTDDWSSPPPLSLRMALQTLQAHAAGHWDKPPLGQSVQVASEPVHQAIHATFHRHLGLANLSLANSNNSNTNNSSSSSSNSDQSLPPSPLVHCTAVAVPRAVARLMARRPDLVAVACRSFVAHVQAPPHRDTDHNTEDPTPCLAGQSHDWVWTTVSFGRTAYAMLRTVTAAPHWTTEETIYPPSAAANLQVKQLRRQCAVESTPHLRHGLALGVRLVAGLDACLRYVPAKSLNGAVPSTHAERRVLQYWTNVWNHCSIQSHGGGQDNPDWIEQAWRAGPNHASVSLTCMIQCPVYDPEIANHLTPLSHPDLCLSEQVRRELLRKYHSDTDFDLVAPLASDVDDESWLWTLPLHDKEQPERSEATTAPLDQMLHGVQAFLKGQSSVEGVDTSSTAFVDSDDAVFNDETKPINLTVVVNMLHAALQAKSADELATLLYGSEGHSQQDPFFSDEDYNLMMPSDSDEEDSEHLGNNEGGEEPHDIENGEIVTIQSVMQAMDAELQASACMSRTWDTPNDDDDDNGTPAPETTADSHVALGAHVLTNLWQSMSDAPGGPGPVQNLLQDMHIAPLGICPPLP